ncbi:putative arginyl-tRNA synthetase [Actinacidiphila reveromycinica]|uniref:arginine--tRNA ligase n=1 Tax=Actinacidiphila reveromycinica TaxID=659352 RepID=A0A7U3UWM5_9ACTN|nr:DALR anticodon-binding domain-containing protein [Streptomyces sp. SN-593]BBB00203.1 putative arginyl-tRNA synthetase [Streptomyces sp. SN-593]
MTPAELSRALLTTVRRAVDAAELAVEVPEKVVVQRPPRADCGDYATNVALQLAGPAGRTPHEVAEILRRRLAREPGIAGVRIAGAGFLNITLSSRAYGVVVRRVRAERERYGYGEGLADLRVTVAAAPGTVRGPLVAEVVNGLLRAAGADPGTAPEPLDPAEPAAPADLGGAPFTRASLEALLGRDATRWALLRPPAEDAPRLDAPARAALLAQTEANPLFRVRYARARARALLRNARDLGISADDEADTCTVEGSGGAHRGRVGDAASPAAQPGPSGPPGPPHHPAETELLGLIADFPRVVESAARRRGPDRVARHLERLADAFARFHDECPVLPKGDEKPSAVHAARLRLTDAAGIVLADGLRLLGISAPDRI